MLIGKRKRTRKTLSFCFCPTHRCRVSLFLFTRDSYFTYFCAKKFTCCRSRYWSRSFRFPCSHIWYFWTFTFYCHPLIFLFSNSPFTCNFNAVLKINSVSLYLKLHLYWTRHAYESVIIFFTILSIDSREIYKICSIVKIL